MKNLNEKEFQWLNVFAKTQDFFKSFLLHYKVKNQLSNNQFYWLNLYINKAEEDGDELLTADQITFIEKYHEKDGRLKLILDAYKKYGFLHRNEYVELLNLKKEIIGIKKAKVPEIEPEVKHEAKIFRIPCPHCSFLCTPQADFCLKCGEPLPKLEKLDKNLQQGQSLGITDADYAEKNIIHSLEMLISKAIPLKKTFNVSAVCYVKHEDQIVGLSLYNCGLSEFPTDIFKLKSLKQLALRRNNIKELPRKVGFLSNLEYLDLRINEFERLPSAIGLLVRLKTLNVSSNKLMEVPEAIGDLLMLKSINLSNNRLNSIPESIGNIEGLERLNIKANFWIKIPENVLNLKMKGLEIIS